VKIAVVGAGIGGLTAAGMLAREGHDVEVFEASTHTGGKAHTVTVDGLHFDAGPTLLTFPHVVREVFARLSASDLLPPITALQAQCDYRFAAGERFVASSSVEAMAEQARVFGKKEPAGVISFYREAEALWRYAGEPYLEAPYESMDAFFGRVLKRGARAVAKGMVMGTLQGLAEKHFASRQMRQYVGRFATYVGARAEDVSAAFAQIPHIERAFGTHHVNGGIGALAKALTAAVERLGVRIHLQAAARFTRDGRGFVVSANGERTAFDRVVVNADPMHSLGRDDEPLALSGFVLFLRSSVKVSLHHHSILFSADYPREMAQLVGGNYADDPTIYVCQPSASDDSMGPRGLYAMVNAPVLADDRAHLEGTWDSQQEKVTTRIGDVFPELRGALSVLGRRTPLDWEALGAPRGSIYGYLPTGALGAFKRPALRGHKGVYFVGGGTHPGGGVPMVMLSGVFCSTLLQRDAGLHTPDSVPIHG
jgi:1-hydroxycarotenoid 3,4-desaturase